MIIVLGGSGFIGRHLRDALIARRRAFTIVARRERPDLGPRAAGEHRMSALEFSGDQGSDLLAGASALVNLAASTVPGTFASEPWREVSETVAPQARLFARCGEINPGMKLVQISSGGTAYGHVNADMATEDTPLAPISGYGLGKVMIEDALRFTGRTTGLRHAILRVSNPVGVHQTSQTQGLVSIAIRAAHAGTTIPVFGEGRSVRDYVDADEVAGAILAACDDPFHDDAVWNVGSGIGHSVLDILALAERATGRRIRVQHLPPRAVDVSRVVLDCTRIEQDLGWRARRGIEEAAIQINASLTMDRRVTA